MKKILFAALLGLGVSLTQPLNADQNVNATVIERTVQPLNFTQDIDASAYERLSVQAVYSDGTPSVKTFTDGAKANARITVSSASYVLASTPTLIINGVTLAYVPVATASGTAKAIADAIMANGSLNTIIVATWTAAGVVASTAVAVGDTNYFLSSSSQAALAVTGQYQGGAANEVVSSAITETAHGFATGLRVLFQKSAGTDPQNLASGTTFYVIKTTDDAYKLATSSTNAAAGTAITVSTFTGGGTYAVTPLTLSIGSAGFLWQASNDATNYSALSITTVTYTAAGNTLWDLSTFAYRYLRLVFTGPTNGAINIAVKLNGRKP